MDDLRLKAWAGRMLGIAASAWRRLGSTPRDRPVFPAPAPQVQSAAWPVDPIWWHPFRERLRTLERELEATFGHLEQGAAVAAAREAVFRLTGTVDRLDRELLYGLDQTPPPALERQLAALPGLLAAARQALIPLDGPVPPLVEALDGCLAEALPALQARWAAVRAAPSVALSDGVVCCIGQVQYRLRCGVCDETAVSLAWTGESLEISRLIRAYPFLDVKPLDAPAAVAALATEGFGVLHQTLLRLGYPGLDGWCTPCGRLHCFRHCTVQEIWSGSWYDTAYLTCPRRHRRELE